MRSPHLHGQFPLVQRPWTQFTGCKPCIGGWRHGGIGQPERCVTCRGHPCPSKRSSVTRKKRARRGMYIVGPCHSWSYFPPCMPPKDTNRTKTKNLGFSCTRERLMSTVWGVCSSWAGRRQGQGVEAQALPLGQAVPASWSPDTERGQKGVSGQLLSSRPTCDLHPPPPGQVWLCRHLGEPGQPCGLHALVGYGPSSAFRGLRSALTRCLWAQGATARALTGPLLL